MDAFVAGEDALLETSGQNGESKQPIRGWRTKRAVIVVGLAAFVVVTLVVGFSMNQGDLEAPAPVAVAVPVALSGVESPTGLKIGVVVTFSQRQNEGAEWAAAAEGAVVAQYRLAAGGSDVELVIKDDRGTRAGSAEAVAEMLKQGVSAVVFATSGEHIAAGLDAASHAKLPVVLPYASIPENANVVGTWSFAADPMAVDDALKNAISEFENPVLVDAGPGIPNTLSIREVLRIEGGDLASLASAAASRTGADSASHGAYTGVQDEATEGSEELQPDPGPRADALVLSGHPRTLATLVTQLQSRNVSTPLILAPNALSPEFAQALEEQGGSISPSLATIGVNVGDAVALGNNDQARALSAYLQSVRQLSSDQDELSLTGDSPFIDVAPWADVRSHDAVLALAIAASEAGSTEPELIGAKLSDMQLGASDGIAGEALDFTKPFAAIGEAQLLFATGQVLGLRPTSGSSLSWFPAPKPAR